VSVMCIKVILAAHNLLLTHQRNKCGNGE